MTTMEANLLKTVCFAILVLCVAGVSITVPDDVVAGREIALKCKITRSNMDGLLWEHRYNTTISRIYNARVCNSSLPLLPESPAGLSGGCQRVNSEEVYAVIIENVTEDKGRGRWICQFGGKVDQVTLDVKVMVTQVTLTNPPVDVLAGDPYNFTCVTSTSKPKACIRGYIRTSGNVRELDPPADCNQDPSTVQATTRTLTFTAGDENNGAELYCNASNSVTDPPVRSQFHTINVQSGPLFTNCKSSYIFVENAAAELFCTIWANPEPKINWSRGAQPRISVTNHRYMSVVRFNKISRTDSGDYIVTASNGVTRGVERTVSVTVYYPPIVSVVLASGNVTEGNPLQLQCRAEAVPQNYTYSAWSRTIGDRPVPLTNHSSGKSLSISQVTFRDQGVYRCGVSNGFGGVQWEQLDVKVRDRPCPPISTSALCTNHDANVTWISCFNGGSTQTFKLQYNQMGGDWVVLLEDIPDPGEGMAASHVVEALEEEEQYVFRVYGRNRVNKSDAAETNCTVSAVRKNSASPVAASVAGGVSGGIVLLGVVLAGVVILRRRQRGNCSSGEKEVPSNNQEMAENPSMAVRVYQTLNLSPSSTEAPVYVNSVPIPEYENTSITTTENDSTDSAYERLRTNAALMFDTNRLYENTRLS